MANNIPEDKQVPILLSSIGASTYSLLGDLLAPETPSVKSLAEISAALRKHFEPKRAVITERYHFYKHDRSVGENITDFNAVLRNLATHCNFGVHVEEALRDRLVCGLQQETIQRRPMEISLSMEAAERNTKSFKSSDTPINKLISRTSAPVLGKSSRPCTHCGHPGHWRETCKFKMPFAMRAARLDISLQLVEQGSRVKRLLLHQLQLLVDSRKTNYIIRHIKFSQKNQTHWKSPRECTVSQPGS